MFSYDNESNANIGTHNAAPRATKLLVSVHITQKFYVRKVVRVVVRSNSRVDTYGATSKLRPMLRAKSVHRVSRP